MKHLLRLHFTILAGLLIGSTAYAAPAPADTVPGQAHFTHLMSAKLCDKLTQESQKTDFAKLSPTEGEALFKRLMLETMGENFTEFGAVMEHAPKGKSSEIGRAIGEQAVLDMVQRCPSAAPLVAQMSRNHVSGNTDISAAERGVLLPVVQAACKLMDEENAKQPFEQLTPEQRKNLLQRTLQGVFLSKAQSLMQFYGDDVLEDSGKAEEVGKKAGLLMIEACPTYIMQIGRDELERQRQPAPAAAKPTTAPVPRKVVPARRPATQHSTKK